MCNEGYGHEIHCKQIEFHVLGTSVDVNNKKIIDKKESFDFHLACIYIVLKKVEVKTSWFTFFEKKNSEKILTCFHLMNICHEMTLRRSF